jgi:hypothetical protein
MPPSRVDGGSRRPVFPAHLTGTIPPSSDAGRVGLHRICISAGGFCTDPSRPSVQDVRMDIVAVLIAVAAFAIMLGLISAIDQI